MTHQPANRPRMAATYASGTVRARRWHGDGDVRGYRPPRGWTARADLTDLHPLTGRALPRAVWWIIETITSPDSSVPATAAWFIFIFHLLLMRGYFGGLPHPMRLVQPCFADSAAWRQGPGMR